ncbi:MAG: AAA family ATPase [Micromonosporaceae bacterium]
MRIWQVTAEPFGPLAAGQTLEFGQGLTVVVGPNESGKSVWHAAIYAALCGRPAALDERTRAFARLFRDDTGPWVCSAVVEHQGQMVPVRQDLLRPGQSNARALNGQTTLNGCLRHAGGLDLTRCHGLDAASYAATAWVAQNTLRSDRAQVHLQRAVAYAVGNGNALNALRLIGQFGWEHIGPDDPASMRPLGRALNHLRRLRDDPDARPEQVAQTEQTVRELRALRNTVDHTYGFLESARRKAMGELTGAVTDMLDRWLPALTDGLYTRTRIDEQELTVTIDGPRGWEPSGVWSASVAEQVLLLQRIALIRYLCPRLGGLPLVLDEVSVNSDAARTSRLLDLLLELGGECQVILFSQEENVRGWARARPSEPDLALRELAPVR